MCYVYDGAWRPNFTGIATWKGSGVGAEKVVMVMPAYGRAWRLEDPGQHGIGAPAAGIWQEESLGVMNYSAIVEFNMESDATVVFDNDTVSAYSYAGTDGWDTTTLNTRVNSRRRRGLGDTFSDSDWEQLPEHGIVTDES
ncbi:class V chitinase CHIT5-like [Salvia splendens]|uniref:class V chitinase CHIT5-like n=1 Tax=Salvia splendens TaxID=180675 RepID=UPI001C276F49|nr:class V chitinase CHIT5-like [Salvia splendens]